MSINKGTYSGRIGSVDELRYKSDSTPILGFSLAVDDGYGDNKKTLWVKCAVSGKRAESLAKILQKGMGCFAEGKTGIQTWEPKNGKPGGGTITLWVNEMDFSGGNKNEATDKPSGKAKAASADVGYGDDIPF